MSPRRQNRSGRSAGNAVRTAVLSIGMAMLLMAGSTRVWSQDRMQLKRESFRLDVPLLVAKQFENIRGLIDQEQWDTALTTLEEVTEASPDALVAVEPGRYVSAADLARLIVIGLPDAGLAAYRDRMDGWAEQRFEAAIATHNERQLQRLLREAYASSFGDDALWTLGEWLWERGEIAAARRAWEQLIPPGDDAADGPAQVVHYPDPEFAAADVRARLVLCSIAAGNRQRAHRELESFRQLHADATGTLAGKSGSFIEILEELIASEALWPQSGRGPDWTTFAQEANRNAAIEANILLEGPQWTIPLAPLEVPNWDRRRPALAQTAPLGRYPVAADGGLFFHNGSTIRAVRLEDGRPLWPSGEDEDVGDIYPPFNVLPMRHVLRPAVGVPRYTTTLHGGRLFALMGPSVLTLPEAGLRASPTSLVCLDIESGEGLLQWIQSPDDLFPPGWMMTGTPAGSGDRLYLPLLRTDPQLEPAVACLNADDHSVIWFRALGQALREPLEGRVELGHQLLTICDDRIYFSTDLGAIASLDAETGAIHWAVTYPSTPLSARNRSEEAANGLMPTICSDGRLFVKPNDSEQLMALDAMTGARLWRRRLPSRIVHLIGVRGLDLLVSGDQLWSLDSASGDINWRFGFDDPAGFGAGRAALAGQQVVWSTHDELYVIDRPTGQAVQHYPLQEILEIGGGHIILSKDRLIIAGRDHITAFRISPASGNSNTR